MWQNAGEWLPEARRGGRGITVKGCGVPLGGKESAPELRSNARDFDRY